MWTSTKLSRVYFKLEYFHFWTLSLSKIISLLQKEKTIMILEKFPMCKLPNYNELIQIEL